MKTKTRIETFHHGDRDLWCLLGPFFASPEVRRELGLPLTSEEGYVWWAALDGEEVIGFAALKVGRRAVEFRHAYVLSQYRGRGIYGRLFAARLAYGRELRRPLVATVNDHSLPVFLAHGFAVASRRGKYHRVLLRPEEIA